MTPRWLVVVACAAGLAAGCGDGDGSVDRPDRTIAFLRAVATDTPIAEIVLDTLAEEGWHEGENLTVLGGDPREVHVDDAADTVAGWVDDGVDLVVALSSGGARAAGEAAPDVPVLFLSNDPTATGLVDDERAPGGHLTGVTFRVPADRTLDLLLRAVGSVERLGLLWPTDDPAAPPVVDDVRRAAADLGVQVVEGPFEGESGATAAVDRLGAAGVDAVLLANAPSVLRAADEIGAALTRVGVPVVANTRVDFALLVLAPDSSELYRQLGRQAGRLLAGTPVGEVPVEDPAGFQVILSQEVARRLGIELPGSLLDLADEVVE